jgi:hypothetical protein
LAFAIVQLPFILGLWYFKKFCRGGRELALSETERENPGCRPSAPALSSLDGTRSIN